MLRRRVAELRGPLMRSLLAAASRYLALADKLEVGYTAPLSACRQLAGKPETERIHAVGGLSREA